MGNPICSIATGCGSIIPQQQLSSRAEHRAAKGASTLILSTLLYIISNRSARAARLSTLSRAVASVDRLCVGTSRGGGLRGAASHTRISAEQRWPRGARAALGDGGGEREGEGVGSVARVPASPTGGRSASLLAASPARFVACGSPSPSTGTRLGTTPAQVESHC